MGVQVPPLAPHDTLAPPQGLRPLNPQRPFLLLNAAAYTFAMREREVLFDYSLCRYLEGECELSSLVFYSEQ